MPVPRFPSIPLLSARRPARAAAVAAAAALAALAVPVPTASAAPAAELGVKSVQLLWANADPANPPFQGTLTVGGTYTCTEPAGTRVSVSFTSLQILPTAMPFGAGTLPCGPGVVDAPWELVSYRDSDVHSGYTTVFLTFDGQGMLPKQFTA
ncbi:hypothetical protein NX801_03935 [Streptomyces sp. LP05-1]|uniref:Uncharacterized protein n=1 Tax=Streptomyces pyxinae TaxID=2970734 RepID=A0ABT2CBS0_9ACTN|nr:hypothetical protein [Streptomyces sp. LP05-1]MCS0634821.1 hypothetical protein [Streptomyces sp. LP05-1]